MNRKTRSKLKAASIGKTRHVRVNIGSKDSPLKCWLFSPIGRITVMLDFEKIEKEYSPQVKFINETDQSDN